jgi:hypothetical protein
MMLIDCENSLSVELFTFGFYETIREMPKINDREMIFGTISLDVAIVYRFTAVPHQLNPILPVTLD